MSIRHSFAGESGGVVAGIRIGGISRCHGGRTGKAGVFTARRGSYRSALISPPSVRHAPAMHGPPGDRAGDVLSGLRRCSDGSGDGFPGLSVRGRGGVARGTKSQLPRLSRLRRRVNCPPELLSAGRCVSPRSTRPAGLRSGKPEKPAEAGVFVAEGTHAARMAHEWRQYQSAPIASSASHRPIHEGGDGGAPRGIRHERRRPLREQWS